MLRDTSAYTAHFLIQFPKGKLPIANEAYHSSEAQPHDLSPSGHSLNLLKATTTEPLKSESIQ